MSEQEAPATESESTAPPPEGDVKTFDEAYVKKLRDEAAKYRTEAKANADAAAKLAALEESQKTETQRLSDQLAAEKAQRETAEREALRHRVAAEKGVRADLIDRLRGDTEEELSADADALLTLVGDHKKNGNVVPREGMATTPHEDEMRAFARNLFQER